MTKQVKIYGERNTGTSFLDAVIRANFRCNFLPRAGHIIWPNLQFLMNELGLEGAERFYFEEAMQDDGHIKYNEQSLGWKHAYPPLDMIQRYPHLEQLVCVVITKDPYSWIHSFYRRPYHKLYMHEPSFSEFIRHYWLTTRRDNLAVSILKNPLELLNAKFRGYYALSQMPCAFVHLSYSELLFDFDASMEKLKAYLSPRCDDWVVPQVCFKGNPQSLADYQKKYRELELKKLISQADQDYIAEALDPQSMAYWGYDIKLS